MISRLLTLLASLFIFCACNNGTTIEMEHPEGNVSIAHLKSYCKGRLYNITSDCYVRGVVVASDWMGELYKSIIVVDDSGGIEVKLDLHDINALLPINSEVEIYCNGLVLARIGGKIEMGIASSSTFPVDNIEKSRFDDFIKITGMSEGVVPTTKRIAEIESSDITRLVRLDNVRFCDENQGLKWCDRENGEQLTTIRTLVDEEGNRLDVRTLSTCVYGNEVLPSNEISVVGVIDYADNRYFLTIVNKLFTR